MEKVEDCACVYTLKSSRDGRIRYVGQTTCTAEDRYRQHMALAKKSNGVLAKWMREEIAAGHTILMGIINENAQLNVVERQVIARLRSLGYDLLNKHDGGGLVVDRRYAPMSDETRAKISKARKGKRHTEETKARMREAWYGRRSALSQAATFYSTDPDYRGKRGVVAKFR